MVPLLASPHVVPGTSITWNSDPPSSGQHFPSWAAYQEYATPVPRGNYVHNLEHGAVALLYNCARVPSGTTCPQIIAALREVKDALPSDPLCSAPVRVRVVLAPDPLLEHVVAAAAWGHTYTADCVDKTSLTQFAEARYGKGPESLCVDGVTAF